MSSLGWTETQVERVASRLQAIGSPIRLKIVCILGEGELSVLEIAAHLGTTQPNISQHLRILSDRGILVFRRDGNRILYSVADDEVLMLLSMIREIYCE